MDINTSNTLKKLTVKVSGDKPSGGKEGSGVIYISLNNPQYAFIFTAKHNLIPKGSKNLPDPKKIKVQYKFDNHDKFNDNDIDVEDCILASDPDDLAILLVSRDVINRIINEIPCKEIVGDFPSTNQDYFFHFRGYPNIPDSKDTAYLMQNCQFLEPDKATFNIKADINSDTSGLPAVEYCAGFSGSGVFIEGNGILRLIGIVTNLGSSYGTFGVVECFRIASILDELLKSTHPHISKEIIYFHQKTGNIAEDIIIKQIQSVDVQKLNIKKAMEEARTLASKYQYQESALVFARLAEYFCEHSEIFQARSCANDSAKQFEMADDKLAAITQYLYAAELALYKAFTPNQTLPELKKAGNLIREVENPKLYAQLSIIQSFEAFTSLDFKHAHELLRQAQTCIRDITDDKYRFILLQKVVVQIATFALLQGEEVITYQVLETALNDLPYSAKYERCEILYRLICFSTEHDNWDKADFAYKQACYLIDSEQEKQMYGLLQMHYGASLAKRGKLEDAFNVYSDALKEMDGNVDAYTMSLLYQNMQYMLQHNGALFFTGVEEHERRRIDLFRKTQSENKGYTYELRAIEKLNDKNFSEAWQYIIIALYYYWQEGAWLGIQDVHKIIATLCEIEKNLSEALFAAIRANDSKAVEKYSQDLRDSGKEEIIVQVIQRLLIKTASVREQSLTVNALGQLADVVPPELLQSVIDFLVNRLFLQHTEDSFYDIVRRSAIKVFQNLAPQLSSEQTNRILKIAFEHIKSLSFRNTREELIRLMGELFAQTECRVDLTLYLPIIDYMLTFEPEDPLYRQTIRVSAYLARTASHDIRNKVVSHLRNSPIQPDGIYLVGFLEEPLSEEEITEALEQILQVNRGVEEKGTIRFGTVMPRQINNFNASLPSSLYNKVIDGLLKIITNEHNLLYIRSDAIWALSDLPTVVLEKRANEITDYLLLSAEGSISISPVIQNTLAPYSPLRGNAGSIEQIRRSSLRAIGRIYPCVDYKRQEKITHYLITASRDLNSFVRQGVALALSKIQGSVVLSIHTLLSLNVLLNDTESFVRESACSAVGNLFGNEIVQFTEKPDTLLTDILERLLLLAETEGVVGVRAAVAHSLNKLIQARQFDEKTQERIKKVLKKLSQDISFRVRHQVY